MGEETEKAFSISSLLTAVPVAGVILAAQYDLGYFGFVDISLFTLFSWSDHIVFALHALLAASLLAAILGWSLYKFSLDIPMNQQPRKRLWFIAIVFGLFAIVSALNSTFDMMLYWIFMALIAVCAIDLRVGLAGILISYSIGRCQSLRPRVLRRPNGSQFEGRTNFAHDRRPDERSGVSQRGTRDTLFRRRDQEGELPADGMK